MWWLLAIIPFLFGHPTHVVAKSKPSTPPPQPKAKSSPYANPLAPTPTTTSAAEVNPPLSDDDPLMQAIATATALHHSEESDL